MYLLKSPIGSAVGMHIGKEISKAVAGIKDINFINPNYGLKILKKRERKAKLRKKSAKTLIANP